MSTKARSAERDTRKVIVENVNVPGWTQSVDATLYDEMRRVLLLILPTTAPGLTQTEIRTAVLTQLAPELFPGGAKADWWSKLVQLDLEAKNIVSRAQTKPLRWHRAQGDD